jgi:2-polyprenyl-6-methoxyphenol hydroxylase-like FAD-dependent oxidoreductase
VKVLVLGSGLGGLLAAMLLGRRGHDVTVVDRDQGPPAGGPEAVFDQWARRGVPQARQPHLFLGRSVRVLRDEAPDILDDLIAAGALRWPIDLGDGPDDAVVCSRRLTFEAVLRRAAERQPGVTVRSGAGVDDLMFDRAAIPMVRGIQLEDGDVLTGDLVIDASGRRSPTPRILARHGLRALPEAAQDCGFLYLSRHYRLRAVADYPSMDMPDISNLGWALSMAFPGDRGTFSLLATVAAIDPLRREITTEASFSRFHAEIPLSAPWLDAGEPISDINTMARIDNRYRRLVDDDGPIVTGIVLLGDAAMHTNPTAGRGVSLAFAHAQQLVSTIEGADSPSDFTVAFDEWTHANIGAWYQLQAGADASMTRRMEAAVRGESLPPPERMEQIRAVMIELSKQASPAGLKLRRMRNLVALPAEVLGDPTVLAAAEECLSRRDRHHGALAGPTRARFAAAAAAATAAAKVSVATATAVSV